MSFRKVLPILAAALVLVLGSVALATPADVIYSESQAEPVAPGITYEKTWEFTPAGWLKLHVLRADLSRSDVRADLLLPGAGLAASERLTQMAQRAGAVAAINGDFFFGRGFGTPIGPVVRDGELISSPSGRHDLAAFGLRRDGSALLERWNFQGSVTAPDGSTFTVAGFNKPGESYRELYAYDSGWGPQTPAGVTQGGLAAVVSGGRVTAVVPADDGVAIPAGATVLVGAGPAAEFITAHLPVGSAVELHLGTTPSWQDLAWALGGGSVLVQDGRIVPFTHEVKGTSPRSAVALSRDGRELLLVAVDGRQEESRGLTQTEWAALLLKLGAYQALNLDGGGSTTVLARLPGEAGAGLVNSPSGGGERPVGDGIGLFTSAPATALAGLTLKAADTRVVPKGHRTITVKGFDANYNPAPVDPAQLKWRVEPASLGTVKNGVFTAARSGRGKIVATLGAADGELPIQVIGPAYRLEVVPSQLALAPGQEAALAVYAGDAQGFRALLDPGDVTWQVLGKVGTAAVGKFTAASEPGSGALEARFGGLSARLLVSVGESEKPLLYFELLQGLSFAGYPQ
ncbi:MAG TPA: phosphodiester glycosidase family protein, partial [Firmicutes bacterium]|nr:phosphodiester glycosidase family protein [Bacillota bacterium]